MLHYDFKLIMMIQRKPYERKKSENYAQIAADTSKLIFLKEIAEQCNKALNHNLKLSVSNITAKKRKLSS